VTMRPLAGLRVVEFAGLGPAPFTAMMFADLGAEVVRIERGPVDAATDRAFTVHRGRAARLLLDLKVPADRARAHALVAQADGLIEGFRPGVMERLGLGPADCLAANPKLVYGRMTGWGQTGPLAAEPGHDINYLALSGALHAIGTEDKPVPPLSLIGDYGGGLMLAFGLAAAMLDARRTGKGQVIDAAMLDGAALLMAIFYGFRQAGSWTDRRADNLVDGGAYFYGTYECADGRFVAIGAIEPQFHDPLMQALGLDDLPPDAQTDRSRWPALRARLAAIFRTRSRDEWCALLEHRSVCLSPVLSMAEAPHHPHNLARALFGANPTRDEPAPAPRFGTSDALPAGGLHPADSDVLRRWGLAAGDYRSAMAEETTR